MRWIKSYSLFENTTVLSQEQIDWLNKCTKGTWKLNPDTGLVDIDGDFNCSKQYLKDFKGVKFGEVRGSFICSFNELTSLTGAPQKILKDFNCSYNEIEFLKGAPQEVGGGFYCQFNHLISLEGAPQKVASFYFSNNDPVSSGTLDFIFNKMMLSGMSYPLALVASKNKISKEDWDRMDKTGLSKDLEKGASALSRFGIFDS